MKKHLSSNTSKSIKKDNTNLLNEFIAAFQDRDKELMDSLLSYDFTYLNGKSKLETMAFFAHYWDMLDKQTCPTEIECMISMDYYPGCVAIRFRFVEFMGYGEYKSRMTLVPVFKDGKLRDLIYCKRAAPMFVLKRLSRNN